jgi:hypothetical protein
MGAFMKEHDIYVGSLQEKLNLRFAPNLGAGGNTGLQEMIALQKEFEIFKEGRKFETSMAVLNVTGSASSEVKDRFHRYLASLRRAKSNVGRLNGDAAIVKAIAANLNSKKPLPVYFELHDLTSSAESNRVLITDRARPLFYMKQDYLVISLPLALDTKAK